MIYCIGDRFINSIDGQEHILSYHGKGRVALTNLNTGMWWETAKKVKNIKAVTESELDKIGGYTFKIKDDMVKNPVIKERI